MTLQTSTATTTGELPPLPRRRRQRMWVLGSLLVVCGAALAGYLFQVGSHRDSVVMVAHDLPAGSRVTASDLTTTTIASATQVATIPASERNQVAGHYAAVDLRQHTLLAASQLTATLAPRHGQQLVTVALKPNEMPARGLEHGDRVQLVATPDSADEGSGTTTDSTAPSSFPDDTPATVDQVGAADAEGTHPVDMVVDSHVGPAVARQAATGQIAIVVTARRTR